MVHKKLLFLAAFLFLHLAFAAKKPAPSFEKVLDVYAFTEMQTKSLIVQHKGKVIYEKYASDWSPEKPHLLWSMSKSITNQLLGIAIYEGRITLEESICDKIRKLAGSDYCKISVQDVLDFGSGLRWNEVYEDSITQSSPISMLYGKNPLGMLSFVLNAPHELKNTPGTTAMYSSGDTLILSELIKRSYSASDYARLPWKKWADKIGISSLVFERDSKGTFIGSSYAYLTARDTLKWGNLLRNNGVTNDGTRILPRWWVQHSTEVTKTYLKGRVMLEADEVMGRQFWLNKSIPQLGFKKAWKYLPEDTYAAIGHWGQTLTLIPSEDLVIVRYGVDKGDKKFKINEFMRYVLQFARDTAIPANNQETGNPGEVTVGYNPGLDYSRDLWFMSKTRSEISLFSVFKAKEYCSCFYVMKQTAKFCKEYVKNKAVPGILAPLRHDEKNKVVKVNSARAQFVDSSYGCKIVYK